MKKDLFVADLICYYDSEKQHYVIHWCDDEGNYYRNYSRDLLQPDSITEAEKAEAFVLEKVATAIEGAVPRNVLEIADRVGERLVRKLTVPENIKVELPERIYGSGPEDLKAVRAKALYSDGTVDLKTVIWDLDKVDWSVPGSYQITGTLHQDSYKFPIAGTVQILYYKMAGQILFIATNDTDGNKTLYIRKQILYLAFWRQKKSCCWIIRPMTILAIFCGHLSFMLSRGNSIFSLQLHPLSSFI